MKNILIPIFILFFLSTSIQITNAQCMNENANPKLTGMTFDTPCVNVGSTTSVLIGWELGILDVSTTVPAESWEIHISFDDTEKYTYVEGSVNAPEFSWTWNSSTKTLIGLNTTAMTSVFGNVQQGTITASVMGKVGTNCNPSNLSNANIVIVENGLLASCPQAFQNNPADDDAFSNMGVDPTSLPVSLLSFGAQLQEDNTSLLQWSIEAKDKYTHFDVQHSTDGVLFNTLSEIDIEEQQHYRYIHTKPAIGNNYYRIKQIDADGRSEASGVKSVYLENDRTETATQQRYTVYPTQATDIVHLEMFSPFSEDTKVSIFNPAGQRLTTGLLKKEMTKISFDVQDFPTGVYFIGYRHPHLKYITEPFFVIKK